MKSPADMGIIQIDITNDCFNRCSNCSRFSGNHKKIYYMDWDTFRKACESLQTTQFKGLVGIMGGEPTLHPEFEKFVRYYDSVIPDTMFVYKNINEPIDNINRYRRIHWNKYKERKRGLFTSLGPGYAKHFELIRNVFEFQCINDHKSNIMHQVNTITRKELGIPDDEWVKLRDECWLQNNWSASITPKGAFFCEVAGALDMLFDGPGGWPIEPGWWKRTPKDFGDQLQWCELCSFCLKTPYVQSHTNTDLVSPEWDRRLTEIGSKKKRTIFDINNYDPSDYEMSSDKNEPYLMASDNSRRANMDTSRFLSLNKIVMVTTCVGYSSLLSETLLYNSEETDAIIVVTESNDTETIRLCKKVGVDVVISDRKNINKASFNKGALINDGIAFAKEKYKATWILIMDADVILPNGFKNEWNSKILNPGTLYFAERVDVDKKDVTKFVVNPKKVKDADIGDPIINRYPWGYFQLFNINAKALSARETYYSEDFLSAGFVDNEFLKSWHMDRWYFTGVRLIHIKHGSYRSNWTGVDLDKKVL